MIDAAQPNWLAICQVYGDGIDVPIEDKRMCEFHWAIFWCKHIEEHNCYAIQSI